jgi:hypothetical protein
MADSAFQIQYRQEFIAQFEQGQSWLSNVCTTEAKVTRVSLIFPCIYGIAISLHTDIFVVFGIPTAYRDQTRLGRSLSGVPVRPGCLPRSDRETRSLSLVGAFCNSPT